MFGKRCKFGLLLGLKLSKTSLFLFDQLLLLQDAIFFLSCSLIILNLLELPFFLLFALSSFFLFLNALHSRLFFLLKRVSTGLLLDPERLKPLFFLDSQPLQAQGFLLLQLLKSLLLLLCKRGASLGLLLLDASLSAVFFSSKTFKSLDFLLVKALLTLGLLAQESLFVQALLFLDPETVRIFLLNALDALFFLDDDQSLALLVLDLDSTLPFKLICFPLKPLFLQLIGALFVSSLRCHQKTLCRLLFDLDTLSLLNLLSFKFFLLEHLLTEAKLFFISLGLQSLRFFKLALVKLGQFSLNLQLVGLFFKSNSLLFLLCRLLTSGFFSFVFGSVGFVKRGKLLPFFLLILFSFPLRINLFLEHFLTLALIESHLFKLILFLE